MKTYRIEIKGTASKAIEALPSITRRRVWEVIEELADDPRPPGCRKISGAEADRYRVRIGKYRVVYRVFDDRLLVLVVRVGHRRDVYRNL